MKTTQITQFEEKVFSYMETHKMLLPGEKVVAGISGGADSVCLLFVLLALREKCGLEFVVVHVNHGIREESGLDAEFVERLCKENDIPFYLREADILALAKEQKCSTEEAGRNYRYQVFDEVAIETGAEKIAVAHNLNDRSETMLFHLFRGSGMKGLAGILPVRDRIIRPLLGVERSEIEAYLQARKQGFCRDATNAEDDYTRNRIRHHVLPYVEEHVVKNCVQHMGRTAELLAVTEDYLAKQTEAAIKQCVVKKQNGCVISCSEFVQEHDAIKSRMLYTLLLQLSPAAKDIGRVHVDDLLDLINRSGNREISLPFGILAGRSYEQVYLKLSSANEQILDYIGNKDWDKACSESALDLSAETEYEVEYREITMDDVPKAADGSLIFPQNEYTKWFDYDKIKGYPTFRTRCEGDYLTIRDGKGACHRKKLKDYLVTEKVPASIRGQIPVFAVDSHIVWLVGYRISEYYKVNESTTKILQISIRRKKDGRTC